MTERFFEFDSQSGDFDRFEPAPWVRRFHDLKHSVDDGVIEASVDAEEPLTHGEIIELIETLHARQDSPFLPAPTSERPYSVYLPEGYEPRYAYPLVVWFHDDGASDLEIPAVMSGISDRNYIGLALQGNVQVGNGFGWSTSGDDLDALLTDVESHVRGCRRDYHVHSERIYLAGFGSGASVAMEMLLRRPEWFGGAACLCGSFPDFHVPYSRVSDLRNKRVLLTTTAHNRSAEVGKVVAAGRLLYAAGVQTGTRVYQESVKSPSPKMLRDVNHWLMNGVLSAVT